MIPLNYHQLYYFWTIAKAGSLKKGSEMLLLAASTLSTQLTQLEKAMKVKMLDRRRDGVFLTTEGRAIFDRCERIFCEGEALAHMIRDGGMPTPSILRLGVQNSVSAWIVLEMILFIETLRKNIRVSVFGGSHQELQDRLHRYSLDVVISNSDYSRTTVSDFDSRLLVKIPLTFIATPVTRKKIKKFPADLANLPLILPTEGTQMRKRIDAYLRKKRITPNIVAEIENPMLILRLARESHGVAVVDIATVKRDIKDGLLTQLHSKPIGLEEYVWLLYNSRAQTSQNLTSAIYAIANKFVPHLSASL